jgi:hypothetical protein
MNLFGSDYTGEISPAPQSPEPHEVRRGVRYAAATNMKQAIARQFPYILATQAVAATTGQSGQGDDDVAKTV